MPMIAGIGKQDGVEMLRVVTMTTDADLSETGREISGVIFQAPLDGMPVSTVVH